MFPRNYLVSKRSNVEIYRYIINQRWPAQVMHMICTCIYRCSGYNCCTCKETYLSVFFKDGIMFYIVGIFIRMSFVHAFIILWTQSNMNTRSAGHCMQPIVNPNCEHFGAYHWLFLCYSIFLSFSKEQDFSLPSELLYYLHLFLKYVVALLQRMLERRGLLVAGGYLLFLLITSRADYNRGTVDS